VSAINVTLLAFAAERRTAAPLALSTGRAANDRFPARRAHSSKPAAAECGG